MLTTMTTMTVTSSKTLSSSKPDSSKLDSTKPDLRAEPKPVLSRTESNAEIMEFIQKIQLKQKKFNELIQQELNLLHWKLKNQT